MFRTDFSTFSSLLVLLSQRFNLDDSRCLFTIAQSLQSCDCMSDHPLILFTQAVFANSAKLPAHDEITYTHIPILHHASQAASRIRRHGSESQRHGNKHREPFLSSAGLPMRNTLPWNQSGRLPPSYSTRLNGTSTVWRTERQASDAEGWRRSLYRRPRDGRHRVSDERHLRLSCLQHGCEVDK